MADVEQRWGRLGFTIPGYLKLRTAAHELRYADVVEVEWPPKPQAEGDGEDDGEDLSDVAQRVWDAKLAELRAKLVAPDGVADAILETRTFADDDRIHAAVYYHHTEDFADEATWLVLAIDEGGGLWVSRDSMIDARERLLELVLDVARAYHNPIPEGAKGHHLAQGIIGLPYKYTEELYLDFRDAGQERVLTIHAKVIDEDDPVAEYGLGERLTGVVASGFADGIDIDRRGGGARTVAGLAGEDIAMRVDQGGDVVDNFMFEYAGEHEDGERPKLTIDFKMPAGDFAAEAELWAALLDSFEIL